MKAEKPGDVIHSDVCGSMNIESFSGSRYFVLFKDAANAYRVVYFLRQNSELFCEFKVLKPPGKTQI